MQISTIDYSHKSQLRDEWEARGASHSDLATLDSELACPERWYAISKDGKTKAVFDVRQAPKYFKNMKVIFAPDICFDDNEIEYENAVPIIDEMVDILAEIFGYHLNDLEQGNNNFFKIYSDHREVRLIFYEFCKYLKGKYPDRYKLKFYGKWIEIHQRSNSK